MSDVSKRIAGLSPQKRALLAKQLRTNDTTAAVADGGPIAIIGMGCRFPPGCHSPAEFWQLLRDGGDAISEVPAERWNADDYYDPDPSVPGKTNMRWGGFIDEIDRFDAEFFGISPREAVWMDPQQRIMLEVAWSALESAGQSRESLAGSQTGVFMGVCTSDYAALASDDPRLLDGYGLTGNARSIVANRLSYLLDLRGPSVALDTACSSSLVALHLACQSLRAGECAMAIAGGINIMLRPDPVIAFSRWNAMAADGRCKAFDARADGFVRSEGCGVIVLKRLSDALADGDPILATVRGSAVNQDGLSTGLTAPNMLAQQAVIRAALANAGVTPDQVGYIEAHGTGTSLGDPIEVQALSAIYGPPRPDQQICALGSVKTNIGHTEAAAGVAGLIKVVLTLQHEAVPPNLHFKKLNPNISLENTCFVIPTSLSPWPADQRRRYAAVSSFGFGGTNAHVIIEEAPQTAPEPAPGAAPPGERALLLPISAANDQSLRVFAQRYCDYLEALPDDALYDACYTAGARRTHLDHRLAVVGAGGDEMIARLRAFLQGEADGGLLSGTVSRERPGRAVFVFPGQGSQWPGMGRELFAHEPVFRGTIEACAQALRPYIDWSLLDLFTAGGNESAFERIDVVQPAIFAVQVALVDLWRSWGIRPEAVIGHSMGEIAAAYAARVLSLDDAARIIACRSRLLRRVSGQGAMAVVGLSFDQAQACLAEFEECVSVAVSNGPRTTVLSGDPQALSAITARLEQQNIFWRSINVDVASHSPQMDPLLDDLRAILQGLEPHTGSVPFYSTVLGRMIDGSECDAGYWVRNLREPVLFAAGIQHLLEQQHTLFLEISPHTALLPAIEEGVRYWEQEGTTLPSLRKDEGERAALLSTLGALYTLGQPIDWRHLYAGGACRTDLPAYPWARTRHWILDLMARAEASTNLTYRSRDPNAHPLLNTHLVSSAHPKTHFWETGLSDLPYLADYQVQEQAILPFAAYVEMILAAAEVSAPSFPVVEQLTTSEALWISEQEPQKIQVVLTPDSDHRTMVRVSSCAPGPDAGSDAWALRARALVRSGCAAAKGPEIAFEALRSRCAEDVAGTEFYRALHERGIQYGPAFRGIAQVWRRDGEALARIDLPDRITQAPRYRCHPVFLDVCFQVLLAALSRDGTPPGHTYVPVELEHLQLYAPPERGCWSYGVIRPEAPAGTGGFTGDVLLLDEAGRVVLEARGLRYRRLSIMRPADLEKLVYQVEWEPEPPVSDHGNGVEQPVATPERWLIWEDAGGVGTQLAQQLAGQGAECVCLQPAAAFQRCGPSLLQFDPADPAQLDLALSALGQPSPALTGLVYLGALDPPADPAAPLGPASVHWMRHLPALLHALAARPDPARLWLITQGAQAVLPEDPPAALTQAPLWSLGRVIALEQPELWGGLLDLPRSIDPAQAAALLLPSLRTSSAEDQLALRGERRYRARLRRAPLPPACAAALDASGSYLISGGLGSLGRLVAADLVARGARHLVLLGRHGLPPREEWAGLPPESEAAAGVALVRALERQGAEVRVEALDVSDGPRLTALLEQLAAGPAPLRGVLHAAGVGHSQPVSRLGPDDWAMVLPSKVAGAWQLDRALRGQQLDFVVYFSSAAAVWGSWGLGAYAVANGYLDALAHEQRARGVAALSVNWGRWAELGLAQGQAAAMAEQFEKLGLAELPTDAALELIWRLVGGGRAQATVAAVDWHVFQPVYAARRRRPFLDDVYKLDQAAETTAQARREPEDRAFLQRLEQAPPQERLELLTEYVQTAASAILGLDPREPLGAEQGFFQAGMDSVMSVELKQRLERSLGCSLPATLAFEQPSPAALADYLAGQVLLLDATPAAAAPASTTLHETVAALSEDQASRELAAELAAWQAQKERL